MDIKEIFQDSKTCLLVSSNMLKEIEKEYEESVLNDNLPSTIKVTIKNFLENVRSALEYPTYYIFNTFCSSNYTEKELKKKKVYFPIRKDKSYFDKCISNDFRGLSDTRQDICKIFENCQSFKGQHWTQNLASLSNKNKHIELTRQKHEKTTKINYLHDVYGNIFSNIVISNCKQDFIYNGRKLTEPNPFIKQLNFNMEVEYLFKDINLPIIQTLQDIYTGSTSVINQLEKVL